MPEKNCPNSDEHFKIVVMSTMSSGKSTFINALLGCELLPSGNEACSAKNITIVNNDTDENSAVHITYHDGTVADKSVSDEVILSLNGDKAVKDVIVEMNIEGMSNTDKVISLIDTPGVNNFADQSHREKTMTALSSLKKGLIVYLLNFTQLCVDDDYMFLCKTVNHVRHNEDVKIIFILNKMDCIDDEKENISDILYDVNKYLTEAGINKPTVFPVTALGALLFSKVLKGEPLSRKEHREFNRLFERFKPVEYSLKYYSVIDGNTDINRTVSIFDEEYRIGDLIAATDNTGISEVKHYIQSMLA